MATATIQVEHHAHAKVKDVTLRTDFSFDTVEESLDAFARGEAIVVMDDERRENEGDNIISASQRSVGAMAWMIKHTRTRLNELEIPMMVPNNQERHKTAMASDFSRPGHMVPLRAQQGGILERRGHTEIGVDLCALTNQPLGSLGVNDDVFGTMARRGDCRAFADRWGLKMIRVDMLVQYRKSSDSSSTHDGSP
ncbi:hypothetical protein P692DRAFT_20853429 [Suillus brevipes Sb2]|nr:hypothetical protein P692DRAFT_20853429 [Suillus brevipes Sb2]